MLRHLLTKPFATAPQRRWLSLPASWAILPLRAFLGSTFVYAGLQKLTDPQFFTPAAPGYIGRQLQLYAAHSPLRWLLTGLAIPHASFFGGLVAFAELWIGLATLLGLFTRLAAGVGACVNVLLWLTATWNVHPYFLGSDSIYAMAWLTLALAGASSVSLDRRLARERLPAETPPASGWEGSMLAERRRLLHLALAGGAVLASGAVMGVVARLFTAPASGGSGTTEAGEHGNAIMTPSPSSGGVAIGKTGQLAINSALTFTLASNDDPGVLVRLSETQYVAYDATCPHAGCPVDYDPGEEKLICPCHGAIFDPAKQGIALAGPTNQPLTPVPLRIDASGTIYAIE